MLSSSFHTARADASHESTVQMIELVTSALTINGVLMDAKPLLKLMDICTCAAAEKHTKVNCVTVSMGDVVFEYFPKCGDLLELTARPVYTGNTSLDVCLIVIAEGEEGARNIVCEAIFTYVTTKGPDGQKRFCPPLVPGPEGNEQIEWEMKMSRHRRNLLTVERKNSYSALNAPSMTLGHMQPAFDLEMSEVVLPLHQNHMGHTFGGVVMAWMAKAALAVAARKSRRTSGSLLVRSVLRVDFKVGSDVSDHLIFRSRLNAIFDEGRSAEVEVAVSKRSLSTGEETSMNVGYFYISGSAVGSGTDKPFCFKAFRRSSCTEDVLGKIREDAEWRRSLMLARRQLLGGVGEAIEWHPSLQDEASLLTIKSVLRLVHHHDHSVPWNEVEAKVASVKAAQWTPGEHWGRQDTFVVRVKGRLPTGSPAALLNTLRNRRPQWDKFCAGIQLLEEAPEKSSQIQWDIVRHTAITPAGAVKTSKEVGVETDAVVPFCLLRTWQIDKKAGTAILATQSVRHSEAGKISGQVRPSGCFINKVDDENVQVTYVAEHDLVHLRDICLGMSDESIAEMMARIVVSWFGRLGAMEHDIDE